MCKGTIFWAESQVNCESLSFQRNIYLLCPIFIFGNFMLVFKKIDELRNYLDSNGSKSVGFVPTMGALHKGHLSLVEMSKAQNDITVCSIFVNPIQFNNQDDLANYPVTIDDDLVLLKSLKCDMVFLPSVKEMYDGYEVQSFDFGDIEKVMEGAHREGHFNGVANVITRFFEIVKPTKAYFGEKDFQQLAIVKALNEQLCSSVEIVGAPIVREDNGLAMSSRNERLTLEQRDKASVIHQGLTCIKKYHNQLSVTKAKEMFVEQVNALSGFETEYIEFADGNSLQPVTDWEETNYLVAFCAVNVGPVRLIDNMTIFN